MAKLNGDNGPFTKFVSGENASAQLEKSACAPKASEAVPQILKKMDRAATELMRAVRAFERGCNRWEAKNNLPDCLLQELPADLFNHYIILQRKIRDCWSAIFQIPMDKGAPVLDGVKDGVSSCSNSDFLVWLDKKEQIVYCKTPLPPKKVACYYAEAKGKLQMRYSVVNAFAPALEKVFRPVRASEINFFQEFFAKTISILVVQPIGKAPVDVFNLDFTCTLIGRLCQGAGHGILMPTCMAVMLYAFPIEKRGMILGFFGLLIGFAPILGPTFSGIMVDNVS